MTWTVTVTDKVRKWTGTKDDQKLDKIAKEVTKSGPEHAEGLRKVKGSVYDVHSADGGDFRIVGVADLSAKSLTFKAVYKHAAKGSGKQKITGDAIPGY